MEDFVVAAGKTYIKIRVSDVFYDTSVKKFTITDVVRYYAHEAHNLSSGCRTLGTLVSDWRGVDNLAEYCLDYFKSVNVKEVRRVAKKFGLTPKF